MGCTFRDMRGKSYCGDRHLMSPPNSILSHELGAGAVARGLNEALHKRFWLLIGGLWTGLLGLTINRKITMPMGRFLLYETDHLKL